MSEMWIAAENGWYIKSPGHMKAEPDYQKVRHKKAADSIERGNVIVFAHIKQGRETELRTYAQNGYALALEAENAKLREDLEDQEGYDQMLRDRLRQQTELRVKAEAENTKLREQIHWLEKGDILHVLTDQEHSDQCERERLMQVSIDALDKENAKLREELAKARDPQRIGGQADPESFVYAIEQLREFRWQHATNDEDAIPYINNVAAAHERDNAKLRELCAGLYEFAMSENPDGTELNFADKMQELGIEVPDGSGTG